MTLEVGFLLGVPVDFDGGGPAPEGFGAARMGGTGYLEYAAINGPATITVITASEWYFLADNPATAQQWGVLCVNPDDVNALFGSYIYDDDGVVYAESNLVNAGGLGGFYTYAEDPPAGEWHHRLVCYDVSPTPPEGAVFLDGVEMLPDGYGVGGVATFDGVKLRIGKFSDAGDQRWPGDLAEVALWPGVDIREMDGTISSETLEKFRSPDGKPVSLGADGSLPTGTAAVVYHSATRGNEAASFVVNRGTGGQPSLVGSIGAATTSPSD